MAFKKFIDLHAKKIVIALSIVWIVGGTIGIVNTFRMARDWHDFHVAKLNTDKSLNASIVMKSKNSTDRSTAEDLQLSGLDRSPYLFDQTLMLTNLLFMVTILTSLFVLYCVNKLDLKAKQNRKK